VVDSLKHWRHYLLGAPFAIKTDHKSLEYLQTQPHLSGRLVRWSQYLHEYNFSLQHIRGIDGIVADALSRRYEERQYQRHGILLKEPAFCHREQRKLPRPLLPISRPAGLELGQSI
jgi:hypothetical protein